MCVLTSPDVTPFPMYLNWLVFLFLIYEYMYALYVYTNRIQYTTTYVRTYTLTVHGKWIYVHRLVN